MASSVASPSAVTQAVAADSTTHELASVTVHACALSQPLGGIQAISFDLDDTLWDNKDVLATASKAGEDWLLTSQPSLCDVLQAASLSSRMMALREARADIAHCYTALRRAAIYQALQEGGVPAEEHDDVVRDGMAAYTAARSAVTLWPGVRNTLLELQSRGYKLVALTNGNVTVDLVPALDGVFQAYISPAQAGHAKPHARPFQMACEAAGSDPQHVLHVGDSWDHDVQGAVQAGMPAVWLDVHAGAMETGEAQKLQCCAAVSHIAGLLQLLPACTPQ